MAEFIPLSLHDALPIYRLGGQQPSPGEDEPGPVPVGRQRQPATPFDPGGIAGALHPNEKARVQLDRIDRKSTRLNSSHSQISYAVFCLKNKKTPNNLDM